ncbi:hypothetical protein [Clostridium tertium]|jgi:hypothetical protein|uniref:hypothetical protein n=1 Tax=Clostridium tertium TaxID=1559 RepID=UPI002A8135D1|nr:hypothetical protein [Clostridium tertium]MDY4606217.1 hypothetical protein [Clostridium tertium]
MKLLKELDNEIDKAQNTSEVISKLEKCKSDIANWNEEILKLEEEFKKSLDSSIPENINELRHNIEKVETEVKLLNQMLNTDVIIYPKVDIIKALEEEYKRFSLDKLKEEIINYQRQYLEGIKVYTIKISEMLNIKKEINMRSKHIDEGILSEVFKWFDNKGNDLKLNIEPISSPNNSTGRIEKEAIRELDIQLDKLGKWGF